MIGGNADESSGYISLRIRWTIGVGRGGVKLTLVVGSAERWPMLRYGLLYQVFYACADGARTPETSVKGFSGGRGVVHFLSWAMFRGLISSASPIVEREVIRFNLPRPSPSAFSLELVFNDERHNSMALAIDHTDYDSCSSPLCVSHSSLVRSNLSGPLLGRSTKPASLPPSRSM